MDNTEEQPKESPRNLFSDEWYERMKELDDLEPPHGLFAISPEIFAKLDESTQKFYLEFGGSESSGTENEK